MDAEFREHWARFHAQPDAAEAFEALEERLCAAGAWAELAELYRRRLDAPSLAAEPGARAELLLRLGLVLEEHLDDDPAALVAYRDAVRLDRELRPALERLRRLYGARGSWEAVLQVGELELTSTPEPEARAQLLETLARVWERELGDLDQADQLRERARAERGDPPSGPTPEEEEDGVQRAWLEASRGDAETALALLGDALARDPDDVQAIDLMVTVLEGAERYAEVVGLLERREALAPDGPTRSAVCTRLAAVCERQLADLAGARSAYERALEADPANAVARAALARLGGGQGSTETGPVADGGAATPPPVVDDEPESAKARAQALRARLLCEEGEAERPLHLQLAELLSGPLGDPEGALAHLRRAVELDPADGATLERALRLADAQGGSFAQLDLLEHATHVARDAAERARHLARRAQLLAEELSWHEEAELCREAAAAARQDL